MTVTERSRYEDPDKTGPGYRHRCRSARPGLGLETLLLRPPFSSLSVRSDARWSGLFITLCSIVMAWREPTSLGCAFEYARTVLIGWFPKDRRPGETYTGFIEFSLNHGPAILEIVQCRLRELLKRVAIRGRCWTVHGWVPIGGDGTRAPTPRTKRNLTGLGGLGRDRKNPQAWLTPLIHLPTGLLWSFIVDRGDSSERGHIKTMLGLLPKDSLFIADAGFVGYGLWRTMVESGQAFLIRAGSNVSLIKGLSREMKAGVRISLP